MKGMLAAVLLGCFVAGTSLRGQLPGKREYSVQPLPDESHDRTSDQPSAVSPQELFKRLSPSIFVVEALDQKGVVVAFGSGVAVAPDQVVTNEHLTDGAKALRVRQGRNTWPATIAHLDADHDLAQLKVDGLKASPVRVRPSETLTVGERVYAIGAPEGLELTLSDGLVSGLRELGNARIIQTTAAISHGSSGGGLFDTEGRLIGITAFFVRKGQNLNFALPGEWVLALNKLPAPKQSIPESDRTATEFLAWFTLGNQADDAGEYERAIEAFKEAIRLKPDIAEPWFNLGRAYSMTQRYDDAVEALRQAIRVNPELAAAWQGLGVSYYALHQNERAVEALREAVRLDPNSSKAWLALGSAYGRSGRVDEAVTALERSVQLDPDSIDAWFQLGVEYWVQSKATRLYSESRRRHKRSQVIAVYKRLKLLDPAKADEFFRTCVAP
jgi:Flp pilus assembly protein TadD